MFKNELLKAMNAAMPANPYKLQQTMLFVLLDKYFADGDDIAFTNDLKIMFSENGVMSKFQNV